MDSSQRGVKIKTQDKVSSQMRIEEHKVKLEADGFVQEEQSVEEVTKMPS